MDEITLRWTKKQIHRNLWRVRFMDFEDLLQEAFLVWLTVEKKYPEVSSAHRCALYRTSFVNQIHDLSKRSHKEILSDFELFPEQRASFESIIIVKDLVASAPQGISDVFRVFGFDPQTGPERVPRRFQEESTVDFLRRVTKMDDVEERLLPWLEGAFQCV